MDLSRKKIFGWVSLFMLLAVLVPTAGADDDDKRHRRREQRRDESYHHGDKKLRAVDNAVYADQCGACHFAYQPELLPAASWKKIIEDADEHFGEAPTLDENVRGEIGSYLVSNAADTSSSRLAGKIMRSLKNAVPERITDIPCIRREHHEIAAEVFQRKSVGSFSNCTACHRGAANGEYDDDDVSIPD